MCLKTVNFAADGLSFENGVALELNAALVWAEYVCEVCFVVVWLLSVMDPLLQNEMVQLTHLLKWDLTHLPLSFTKLLDYRMKCDKDDQQHRCN